MSSQTQPPNDHILDIQIALPQELMKSMVDQIAPILVRQLKAALIIAQKPQDERKLAYSPKEAAKLLGTSIESIYRLINRGLLKPSVALRRKLISAQINSSPYSVLTVPTAAQHRHGTWRICPR